MSSGHALQIVRFEGQKMVGIEDVINDTFLLRMDATRQKYGTSETVFTQQWQNIQSKQYSETIVSQLKTAIHQWETQLYHSITEKLSWQ